MGTYIAAVKVRNNKYQDMSGASDKRATVLEMILIVIAPPIIVILYIIDLIKKCRLSLSDIMPLSIIMSFGFFIRPWSTSI